MPLFKYIITYFMIFSTWKGYLFNKYFSNDSSQWGSTFELSKTLYLGRFAGRGKSLFQLKLHPIFLVFYFKYFLCKIRPGLPPLMMPDGMCQTDVFSLIILIISFDKSFVHVGAKIWSSTTLMEFESIEKVIIIST